MKWVRTFAAVVATASLLAGCVPPPIPYDKTAAANIRTVQIVAPEVPGSASVVLASSVGQSFGLIGALVDAGIQANREARFKDIMDANSFQVKTILLTSLTERLQQHGYKTVLVPFVRPTTTNTTQASSGPSNTSSTTQNNATEFPPFSAYPKSAEPPADAILDVIVLSYGYMATGISSGAAYRPIFHAKVRLVDAKTGTVLMQDQIAYNPLGSNKNVATIAPDPAYGFANVEAMSADPAKTIMGLKIATEESGKTIANLLRQQ